MANLITNSIRTSQAQRGNWVGDPLNPELDSYPLRYCKTCERFYSDHPDIVKPEDFGWQDMPNGQVRMTERLFELREVAGIPVHRWQIGQMMHEEAIKGGY